jgi:hypothetical protein
LAPSVDYEDEEVEHKGVEEIKFTKEPSDGDEDGFYSEGSKSKGKLDVPSVKPQSKNSSRIKDLSSNDDSDSSDNEFEQHWKLLKAELKDDLSDLSGMHTFMFIVSFCF